MCKRVIICLVIILLVALLFYIGMPIFAIGGEFLLVKTRIQNTYVDAKFRDWKQVSIEDVIHFYIPERWALEKQEQGYAIVDEKGQVWAKGNFADLRGDPTGEFNEILCQLIADEIQSVEYCRTFAGSGLMDGSELSKISAYGRKKTVECYVAYLLSDMYSGFYWISECDPTSDEVQYDILEAITYSFAYYSDLNRFKWLMLDKTVVNSQP